MITETLEALSRKSIDQYKIIEDRYLTLKRYLNLFFEKHNIMTKEDAELILMALDDEPIEVTKEVKTNE